MKLPIINVLLSISIFFGALLVLSSPVLAVDHGMSPREGYVKTATGAPIAGVKVIEYTDECPSAASSSYWLPGCPVPVSCHSERSTITDATGHYYFEPGTPPVSASNPCELNAWWRYTCQTEKVYYRIVPNTPLAEKGIITSAHAQDDSLCPPVQHPTTNVTMTIDTDMSCKPPFACNVACSSDSQCQIAEDGCTACVGGVCKPPSACKTVCERDDQCAGSRDGCTSCLPSDTGEGKVCSPPAACNVACTKDGQCAGAKDGCTACAPSDTGTGNVCRPPAACGVACTKDGQCAGAKDGCTACVGGVCKIPPACGIACTTKAECTGAKDGCSECLEGTCTDFSDNMCKCDGIVADMGYPTSAFKFEAFGKVEGNDTKKAEIADITFRMTKDNQVVAKSNPITPEIVENSATKTRFKAAWQTAPPQVDKNATYRVFADVRCKPKKIVASSGEMASVPTPTVKQLPVPKGTQLVVNALNQIGKLLGKGNDLISREALAQFSQASPLPNQADSNLQLKTLNFIKMLDTDNCRFVMWKYDETLF